MKNIEINHEEGPVDITAIDFFEKSLNIKFPDLYKKLLSKHNGFTPVKNMFNFYFNGENSARDVNFCGFWDISKPESIQYLQQEADYCYNNIIVIGIAANGDYICFDYRKNPSTDNPPVILMFHDDWDDNDKMVTCPVANNFEEFIDLLYDDPDEE